MVVLFAHCKYTHTHIATSHIKLSKQINKQTYFLKAVLDAEAVRVTMFSTACRTAPQGNKDLDVIIKQTIAHVQSHSQSLKHRHRETQTSTSRESAQTHTLLDRVLGTHILDRETDSHIHKHSHTDMKSHPHSQTHIHS